jgi:4-phospho-D-threonate 3-dehydrogenase / 4-phospho-D-erythronate 3-dehydrogenase
MTAPLALTMGDPAGIGPEICAKALASDGRLAADVVVVGDRATMQREVSSLGLGLTVNGIDRVADRRGEADVIDVLEVSHLVDLPIGEVSAAAGAAAFDYIRRAVAEIGQGDLRAVVTAPINKEALSLAGVPYPGHTEMLADLAGVEHVTMMLYNPVLRVVLVSVHVSLLDAIRQLDFDAELRTIRAAASVGPAFGLDRPRIAVAGLNPHAGEGGLFGDEEARIITPAIQAARAEGHDVTGPLPGDTVFMSAREGAFDVVVAQYHDQGLIPIKYLGLDEGVNVTLGLPFVRTSVDHGTAFAIAGKGIASASSLVVAIEAAEQFSRVVSR